ncbi:MAG: hypothetical protein NTY75_00385, partial [Candidatus Shapirobacteria bacterium]|nr:hypothetical protein [Candidatus Shapirobacteria bacterium]
FLLTTVPHYLELHPSPIDNGFRPCEKELVELFPGFEVIKSETWVDEHYREPYKSDGTKKPEVTGFFGKRSS